MNILKELLWEKKMFDWKKYVTIESKKQKDDLPIQIGNSIVVDGYLPDKKNAVFTHFHHDHMARIDDALDYDKILVHQYTYDVAIALKRTRKFRKNLKPVNYGQTYTTKFGEDITLYDADHILGSAQVHVKVDNTRILYSGDFLFPSADTPKCDILILDATHGSPQFEIPTDRGSVLRGLLKMVKEKLFDKTHPQSIIITADEGIMQEIMNFLDKGTQEDNIFGDIPFIANSDDIKIKNALYGIDSKFGRNFHDASSPEAYHIKKYKSKCIVFTTKLEITDPYLQHMFHVIVDKYANFHNEPNISEHKKEEIVQGKKETTTMLRINLLSHSTYSGILDYVERNEPKVVLLDSSRSKQSVKLASDITKKFTIPGISLP